MLDCNILLDGYGVSYEYDRHTYILVVINYINWIYIFNTQIL